MSDFDRHMENFKRRLEAEAFMKALSGEVEQEAQMSPQQEPQGPGFTESLLKALQNPPQTDLPMNQPPMPQQPAPVPQIPPPAQQQTIPQLPQTPMQPIMPQMPQIPQFPLGTVTPYGQ